MKNDDFVLKSGHLFCNPRYTLEDDVHGEGAAGLKNLEDLNTNRASDLTPLVYQSGGVPSTPNCPPDKTGAISHCVSLFFTVFHRCFTIFHCVLLYCFTVFHCFSLTGAYAKNTTILEQPVDFSKLAPKYVLDFTRRRPSSTCLSLTSTPPPATSRRSNTPPASSRTPPSAVRLVTLFRRWIGSSGTSSTS